MRKKILVTVIVMMMTVFITMLSGCGEKGSETADNGEISEKKLKKADTVSEFFSDGKHYLCHVTGCTKGGQLIAIYFFEDGKVTKLHGDAYDCTLGDLAQMSDDEIWNRYEEVKETYNGPLAGYNFYDKPIKFVIETDGTGNVLEKESIYIPSESNPSAGGNIITFDVNRGGVGGETQIYDKKFFYYATSSSYYFCTTEIIKMDDMKSKNCIVDPSSEDKMVMFEDK